MYCPECGCQVADGARFCPKCGNNMSAGREPMREYSPYQNPNQNAYTNQYPDPTPALGTTYAQKLAQAAREGLGMNWYKFIIYVQCFLGFFGGIIAGVMYLLGLQYGENASLVYGFYSSLKVVDIVYGILNIVIALLFILVRFGLKGFKSWSVGLYLLVYPLETIGLAFYRILTCDILDISPFEPSVVITLVVYLIVGIAAYYINYIYFNHRRHLFSEA